MLSVILCWRSSESPATSTSGVPLDANAYNCIQMNTNDTEAEEEVEGDIIGRVREGKGVAACSETVEAVAALAVKIVRHLLLMAVA